MGQHGKKDHLLKFATKFIVLQIIPPFNNKLSILFFVSGMSTTDMRTNAYPLDFQHLSTGEDPAKLIDLLKLHQRTNSSSTTDDSD